MENINHAAERRSKRKRKPTQKAEVAATKTNTNSTAPKKSRIAIRSNVFNHHKIIACESPIRSPLSQKIAEVTAKSLPLQCPQIVLEYTNEQEFVTEISSQKIAEVTAKSVPSQGAQFGLYVSKSLLDHESVRSPLSQKIAEVTAKSLPLQCPQIGLEYTNEQEFVTETSSQKIAEVTAKSVPSQGAQFGLYVSKSLLDHESVRSPLSQKIAEVTAKSLPLQCPQIGLEYTNEQEFVTETSSQKIAEVTAKSVPSQGAQFGLYVSKSLLDHESVLLPLSQKIAEVTAKSLPLQCPQIGLEYTNEQEFVTETSSQKIAEVTAKSVPSQGAQIGLEYTNEQMVDLLVDRKIGSCIVIKRLTALGRKGFPEKFPNHVYITRTHFIELSKLLNEMIQVEISNPNTTKKRFKLIECHWEYDTYMRQPIHNKYSEKCNLCRQHVDKMPHRSIWWFPFGSEKFIKMSFKDFNNNKTFNCSWFSIRTYGFLEVELTVESWEESVSIRRNF